MNTVAKQTLRGRNATIFEKLVINPVLGRPSGTVDELARQFGVAPARIYRIKDKIKRQMTMAVEKHKAGVSFDPEPTRIEGADASHYLAGIGRPTAIRRGLASPGQVQRRLLFRRWSLLDAVSGAAKIIFT